MTPSAAALLHEALANGPDPAAPLRLRRLHGSIEIGTTLPLEPHTLDAWPEPLIGAVLEGGGFGAGVTHATTTVTSQWTLPDSVAGNLRVLVVGLNPSPMAADTGIGFARPGNRFWPAALRAGLVDVDRDPGAALQSHRVGMTDLVKRTTRQAGELSRAEYAAGLQRLELLVAWLRPAVTCVVGLSGWRATVDRRAVAGEQATGLGDRPVYLMPNPSGLNAHVTVDDLADHFRAAMEIADRRR